MDEHAFHLHTVSHILREKQLYAKMSKCDLWIFGVVFLDHVISRDDVSVDPSKTGDILNWSRTTKVSKIRSFFGMAGYYQRFLEKFSQIAKSMTQLTKKNVPFVWKSECEKSFHELHCCLTTALVLDLPSGSGGYVVYTDAYLHVADALSRKIYVSSLRTSSVARVNDGLLCLSERVVVLDDSTLREEILTQAHRSRFSVHLGSIKMYKDLRTRNCNAIKVFVDRLSKFAHFLPYNRDFTFDRMAHLDRDPRFSSRFWGTFQRALGTTLSLSTAYHSETDRQSKRTIRTLEDMLRATVMDFGPVWHDHLALDKFGVHQVEYPQLIQQMTDAVELIRRRIKAVQDLQASYANTHRRPLNFEVGEHVFLQVSPFQKVMRFGLKGKLSPRFIGPFEILEKVGDVAYRLALPPYLSSNHDVFHVSLLRQYVADDSHILHRTEVQLEQDLSYVKRPLRILDKKDKVLRNKRVPLVIVQWQRRGTEEAT
ncbi:uncharacterized protein [Henckelia pumila]|uniref:uncharacterized protein n=1 Tax=Henckelia pumila TaxID=405737 RepID=UPI003C6E490B